jgi:hypothetical protein
VVDPKLQQTEDVLQGITRSISNPKPLKKDNQESCRTEEYADKVSK